MSGSYHLALQAGVDVSPAQSDTPAARPLDARLAVLLDGDPGSGGSAASKFALFLVALVERCNVVSVTDLTLRGPGKALAGVMTWRRDSRLWREHYRKNPVTFAMRSRASRRRLRHMETPPELVLQVGAMSNPSVDGIPVALYLDFTSERTRREWPQRAPMSQLEWQVWLGQERQAYADAAVIFCRSEYIRRSLLDEYAVAPDRVIVVGGGVNVPLPDIRSLQKRTSKRVLFIGSDFRRKGGDVLLAAWPSVVERVPDAELTVIGPAPRHVPDGVEVVRGPWDPLRVVQELTRASVFAMPSRCETWGDVFLEAMAYGLPCVGTTNDAMPEIIVDGETGWLVAPDDPRELADRIIDLLVDPDRSAAMGAAGRELVERQFLWEHVVDRMLPALDRAAENGGGSSEH